MRKKTVEERKLRGTYRADRDGTGINMPNLPKPQCPSWLDETGRATWGCVTAVMDGGGLSFDVELMATFCDCYAHLIRCSEKLRIEGYTLVSDSGLPKINPTVNALRELQKTLIECAKSLGLSLDSRLKVGIEFKNQEINPLDEFLKTGKVRGGA